MKKLQTVHVYSSRIDAEVAKNILEGNNIKSVIFADDAGGARPFLANSLGVYLKVKEDDLEHSKKILKIKK